jgi:hypothetical protein
MRRNGFGTFGPPIAAWLAGTALLVTTVEAYGFPPLRTETWVRWDSHHYLDIAAHGYTLVRCPPPRHDWCGNSGWFPAYPWIVGAFHSVVPSLYQTAVVTSWFFGLAALVLLWNTFLDKRLTFPNGAAILYAAVAPGQVYEYAAFPLSLLAVATTAHLWLLARDKWLAAGLTGAVAVLAYPVGVVVVPTALIWLLFVERGTETAERFRRVALVAGTTLLGLAALPVVQRIEVGRWDAYVLVERSYHHSLENPFATVAGSLKSIAQGHPASTQLQTLLVTIVVVSVLVELSLRRFRAPTADLLVALWATFAWLFAHLQTNLSVYRTEATLFPVAALVRRLPRPLSAALVVASAALVVPMARDFVRGRLI